MRWAGDRSGATRLRRIRRALGGNGALTDSGRVRERSVGGRGGHNRLARVRQRAAFAKRRSFTSLLVPANGLGILARAVDLSHTTMRGKTWRESGTPRVPHHDASGPSRSHLRRKRGHFWPSQTAHNRSFATMLFFGTAQFDA